MPRRSAARALTLALLVAVAGGIPLHSHDAAAAAGPASPAAASTGAFPAEGQSVASGLASKGAFPIEGQSAASGLAARRGGGGHVRGGAFTAAAAERHGVDWLSIMERLLKWRRNGIQPGPEFDFVPQLVGSILPGASLKWDAPCFSATSAVVRDVPTQTKDGAVVTVTIELQGRTEMICEDAYLLATPWRYLLLDEAISGSHVEKWGPMTSDEHEDLLLAGIRIFRFPHSIAESLVDMYDTARLFASGISGPAAVSQDLADRNRKFLQLYANIDMPPLPAKPATLDEALVKSGDFFGIVRLDGLDPLIMWGTGSHLGHTAIALRDPADDALYMCESQSKSNYWPTDRIQCNHFASWMALAAAADYNVVFMPLNPEARAAFDAAAAWKERTSLLGVLYGFPNMLFGWIDTPSSNFPHPLSAELLASAFAVAEPLYNHLSPVPSLLNGAIKKRLGLPDSLNATTASLLLLAEKRGLSAGQLIALPEQDQWISPGKEGKDGYPAGPSMVCNVFVCRMWKAGPPPHLRERTERERERGREQERRREGEREGRSERERERARERESE
ncbi:hypothetical protein T484DRAFT_2667504 [Baffinella frigidus]|nr:hypothetical protein T484DRAFT_2667504 [Cryptophyta sp. CCMP2293]